MGTPRASTSVDQMRNVQKSARRGGECTAGFAVDMRARCRETANGGTSSGCRIGAIMTTVCCDSSAAAVDSGGFFCGKRHDFIVAQQAHCCAGAGMLIPHACAGAWLDPVKNATTKKAAVMNRFVIQQSL